MVLQTCTYQIWSWIIVKNLPSKHVTEERLRDVFSRKGEIADVKLKRKSDGKSRQFAYIGFRTEQEAQDAITYVNKCFIDTYRISVEVADPPPREEGKENTEHFSNAYAKGDKKIKKKPEVSPDGADEPNKAKISLLDSKKTRKIKVVALVGDDVSDMEYYKSRTKKNLSDSDSDCETYGCEDAIHVFPIDGDIEADRVDKEFTIHVFGFGHQDVVFLEPIEAREALKGMGVQALQRCSPVSGAPRDILEPKALADNNENTSDVEENDVRRRLNLDQQVGIDSDITEVCPLYDCCGRFETMYSELQDTDESLKKHLTELVKQGKILSFKGTVVDGHALILSFSKNKPSGTVGKDLDKDTILTKLHVKNIAFEATMKEVRQLFTPFGQIKSVGLPERTKGRYAGYGFIEFETKQEALNAKKALSNTHFYGLILCTHLSSLFIFDILECILNSLFAVFAGDRVEKG
ncbi:putative RNA recognition motif domain, nucleotide-binding alpha-beta plait domain superfamily [Arabidopsis thaliana]